MVAVLKSSQTNGGRRQANERVECSVPGCALAVVPSWSHLVYGASEAPDERSQPSLFSVTRLTPLIHHLYPE